MEMFEEQFKTRAQSNPKDLSVVTKKVVQKAQSKMTLIDANKAKNLAITLRKGGMKPSDICTAIEMYVLQNKHSFLSHRKRLIIFSCLCVSGTTSSLCPWISWSCWSILSPQTLS